MPITIRSIEARDLSEVVGLLREFAELEKLTDYFGITEERLNAARTPLATKSCKMFRQWQS